MILFPAQSIKQKLIAIILMATIATLIAGFAITIVNDIRTFRHDLANNIGVIAKILGESCVSPLAFQDADGAKEILETVAVIPSIVSAAVYDEHGKLFASYTRNPLIHNHRSKLLTDKNTLYEKAIFHLNEEIRYRGRTYGHIYLCSSTKMLFEKIRTRLLTMALILIGLFIVAYFLAVWLQRIISVPLLQLVNITQEISNDDNYTLTLPQKDNDEIGLLYEGFNTMLARIAHRKNERDRALTDLKGLKDNLEIEVQKKRDELMTIQARLIHTERLAAMGQLGGTIAHEFRNQLGVIRNAAYFIKIRLKDTTDEKLKKNITIMEDEIILTNRIIDNILLFASAKEPTLTRIDIHTFLEDVTEKARIKKKEAITFTTTIAENAGDIYADEVQLFQIFLNVLVNAIDAIEDTGQILIDVKKDGGDIVFCVTDTGIGIPDDIKDRLFEPLFTTKARGAGFGLPTVKNLVERHNGHISISSQESCGTQAIIRLPYHGNQIKTTPTDN